MQIVTLLPSTCYPAADAREILQGNPPAGVFGKFYDSLADDMVNIGCKSLLSPTQRFQPAFDRPGSLALLPSLRRTKSWLPSESLAMLTSPRSTPSVPSAHSLIKRVQFN